MLCCSYEWALFFILQTHFGISQFIFISMNCLTVDVHSVLDGDGPVLAAGTTGCWLVTFAFLGYLLMTKAQVTAWT